MLLDSDERLAENDLEELVGGKKKLQIKAKIEICYVEVSDSTSTKSKNQKTIVVNIGGAAASPF